MRVEMGPCMLVAARRVVVDVASMMQHGLASVRALVAVTLWCWWDDSGRCIAAAGAADDVVV
jgi:hypothetical protein